jgi:hypothetical protein
MSTALQVFKIVIGSAFLGARLFASFRRTSTRLARILVPLSGAFLLLQTLFTYYLEAQHLDSNSPLYGIRSFGNGISAGLILAFLIDAAQNRAVK